MTEALSAYKSHDLNIRMKTSSGDVIDIDLSNEKSLQYARQRGVKGSSEVMKFSSMQSFHFSIESKNGIDEQDKREIAEFMKIAQPYLEKFVKELDEDAPKSPVTKLASQIADAFASMRPKSEDTRNYTKNAIVDMFDKEMQRQRDIVKDFDKLFENARKLLEKTLQMFDKPQTTLYA